MAGTLRSSLPSRLRQLLSGEGHIGPNVKLDSETPPKVKAFIDKVIQCPLQDLAIPLSGFHWEYNKGNFHHWRPLFLHFDTYFKTYLSSRQDLLLADTLEDDTLFPKQSVLQILRVMQIILENCHNKSSFDGLEHFKLLLASTDPEILIATLETLSALVKINPSKLHASGKLVGCGAINSCLLSLAQGWGSKEEGLGLYSCVMLNEKSQDETLSLFPSDLQTESDNSQNRVGSTLYFELHGTHSSSTTTNTSVIHIPDLHLRKEDDLSLMKLLIEQYNVPPEHRFSLLTRVRYAHAFRSSRICRLYSKICLLAFIVLVQSSDSHDELVSFFANEPEYTNELIRLVKSEDMIPGTIRTLAMIALGSQLAAYSSSHERARILSGSSISFAGGNRMILLNVLQRAISSLNKSSDPSSIAFVEALLQFYLLHVISTSSSGSVIRGSGMVPTFLPLLEDSDPSHMHLVCLAVKTLQKLMDYSNSAVTLFKDLGGVELLTNRLQIEVLRVIGTETDDNSMSIGECSYSNSNPGIDWLYSQKRLIRVLLKALGSATYAPANSSRAQGAHDVSLPATLSKIFGNVSKFGGDIYSAAVTVMSEMIHKDPTCYASLDELSLPDSFLQSIKAGVLSSSKALTCIPNGIGAICLNTKGLESVKDSSALRFLVEIFTDKKYVLAMNDGIVPLANAVEELLRHVSTLRGTGVDMIIEIVNKIASIEDCKGKLVKVNKSSVTDMDTEDKENVGPCLVGATATDLGSEGIGDEQFIQLCIFHVMVLVHRTMENAETCRLFVEKAGIDALLKLLLRPSITQSSEGMSIALHSTMVFKSFTQHHSAPLARAFCSALRGYLKSTLTGFSSLSGSFLLDPNATPDTGVFSSLFLVEFLLFLAASKDNRWVTALLHEFGNDSKDVLEDIGRTHREILWQIALLEDVKLETGDGNDGSGSGSALGSRHSESNTSESEEQRFNSFRQFLDPLLRRRMSGWSFESQFFDLITLYRDLTNSSGLPQHLGGGGGDGYQSPPSGTADVASSGGGPQEADKQKSYYSSCCDMMKSLSLHITHLFQELGKAMLLPSRRRDETMTVTPASKSVASTFAAITLDHMNFEGHVKPSGLVSWSPKCRYLGKVIDFIDGILLEKPDTCNPVLLNCLYGRGVIQSVLTTFEATSELLFTVNRTPASPMETDEGVSKPDSEETVHSWIDGPLASYGKLMDHLVTSSYILSPFTKHFLTHSLVTGDMAFPRDAEVFVKLLQSMILKTVLPVWTHPQFTNCNDDFIATVISIIRHIFSGVEVRSVSNTGSRLAGPPPNETTISMIVEMGFSRARAEEALRQVGSNSVELAMEWLFSHPEEVQEDDELARALAMSLGNSGTESKDDTVTNENSQQIEEETMQLPPVDDLLSTCKKLLEMKDSLAFPVRDLLAMICSQDEGKYRSNVISFILEQVKLCGSNADAGKNNMLSSLFHVLALILNEDKDAREVASKSGLVKVAADLLSDWNSRTHGNETLLVPKWVTAAFLAVDRLSQVDQNLNADILELLKKDDGGHQNSVVIDDEKQNKSETNCGLSSKHIDVEEQKRFVEISCGYLTKQLPAETIHAVLQLCSTLTRTHSVAVSFLEAGGLPLLLSLPTSSLFVGFDNVAATIIRHILEDPQTLQQAMESEIKHNVVTAANRQSNGRFTPRNFLLNLTSVISRDPVIFMRAARAVCQIEMIGERPYVILLKDREKDKFKENGKENIKPQATTDGNIKIPEVNNKNVKAHRKPPHSFTTVIELLLESIITFIPPSEVAAESSSATDMEIDIASSKGKGKAIGSGSEVNEDNGQESSASLAKVVFILKLLKEILMMYSPSVHVLLRKDAELNSSSCGGIFHHILCKFLPHSRNSKREKKDADWRHKLAGRASQFLVASCVRSTEARRRIFMEINNAFADFIDNCKVPRPPGNDIQAFVDLLGDVLAARSPTGSSVSGEVSVTFIDVGLVRSLTRTLQMLDLDHAESLKVVPGLVKVLELITKEHVHAAEANTTKDNPTKPNDYGPHGQNENTGDIDTSQSTETASQPNANSAPTEVIESFRTVQTYGGSEVVTDYMEHDQDIDGGFAPPSEDDYMHDTSEETRGLENGLGSVEIRFEIQPDIRESLDEDDEDMSGDGDEVNEDEDGDDDEQNDLEEDEVHHHLPHPDTDQDDHDIEDEFDEDMIEEEDEDDEDDDGGVLLRLGEGMNGINVLDHIEVFGREHSINNDTLHVMPVEVFGSRRQGRTTSIYNLLGRSGDGSVPFQHPLLMEPSSLRAVSSRRIDNARDGPIERNLEPSSSRLDSIFRSLRNGRHGQHGNRLSMWTDDQQSVGSNSSSIPLGLEDLLVSHLRRPTAEKGSDQDKTVEGQTKNDSGESQESAGMVPETTAGNNGNSDQVVSHDAVSTPAVDESQPTGPNQSVDMQFDQNDGVSRDVEAVSQESSGSGATLGESLRSLDVEIGSADGHDEGPRRVNVNVPLNTTSIAVRDASLHSVTEVSENPSQETDQSDPAQDAQRDGSGSVPIDPAFLDALPQELRAEVLSGRQGPTAQPSNTEPQNDGDIDPEFLAALPPDIRAEVLAQQQQAQGAHRSQELEGQPVEMDTVSIIATFPSELREEVLLTSSDAVLANLTPALVAEANMLRERFARRYNRTFFGRLPRSMRSESSRRGEGVGSGTGGVITRRSTGSKPVETNGAPLVDMEDLKGMIRLLRVVQPLYKPQLQRLLLNLCAHVETRSSVVKILIDLLMLDIRKPGNNLNTSEPSYRLYACQTHVMYSRPQCFDGVPPLVSRRVLETLTYLARNHTFVAKLLLQFRIPPLESESLDKSRGKAVVVVENQTENQQNDFLAITMLLSLLNQPLYLRSIAHLEQLLNLLDVIIDNTESMQAPIDRGVSVTEDSSGQMSDLDANVGAKSSKAKISSKPSSSGGVTEYDPPTILLNLPQAELRLLCSLLARECLSDNAYALVAEVLKKLVTWAPRHCHLFITELAGAMKNLTTSAMDELHRFGEIEKALITTTASDGAAILRVIQALSSLVASLNQEKDQTLTESDQAATLSLVGEINLALEPLWTELSNCISKIESYSDLSSDISDSSNVSSSRPSGAMPPLPAGTQNILPYIESFFVMCEKLHPGNPGGTQDFGANIDEAATTSLPSGKVDEKHVVFFKFSEKHRKLLNAFIRQNPGLLEKSFSLMLKVPRFIDFDNKRAHFRSKIKHQHDHHHHSPLRISVRRAYILEDSYNQLRMRSTQDLKGRLTVHFQGEEGIDAGGLTREWYQLLSRVIFDKGALLFTTVGNDSTFQPNPNSVYQTEHLSYFKFVGRVVGKALFDGQLLDVHFTRSFYKHILGAKVTYHDIEAIDPGYFKNLKWMLENDISDILDLTFSIDADEEKMILCERSEVTDYELIPGGRNIRVTEENKHKYVDLIAEHRLTTAIRPQINAFLEGFNELISRDLISIFHDKELELLISGLPDIDLDDLKANTEYSGYSAASPIIQWFWEVAQAFSKEDKARLLQFVTGTSKVPLEGFSALQGISGSQKFQIHKAYGRPDHLPSAHTCFNQLDLPEYPTKEHLEERLLLAIHEANEGFGFG